MRKWMTTFCYCFAASSWLRTEGTFGRTFVEDLAAVLFSGAVLTAAILGRESSQ